MASTSPSPSSSPPPSKRRKLEDGGEEEGREESTTAAAAAAAASGNKSSPSNNDGGIAAKTNQDESLEDDRKPAAISKQVEGSKNKSNDDDNNNDDGDDNYDGGLPLAPSLEEYFKNGGHAKYAPRPEWYHNDISSISAVMSASTALRRRQYPQLPAWMSHLPYRGRDEEGGAVLDNNNHPAGGAGRGRGRDRGGPIPLPRFNILDDEDIVLPIVNINNNNNLDARNQVAHIAERRAHHESVVVANNNARGFVVRTIHGRRYVLDEGEAAAAVGAAPRENPAGGQEYRAVDNVEAVMNPGDGNGEARENDQGGRAGVESVLQRLHDAIGRVQRLEVPGRNYRHHHHHHRRHLLERRGGELQALNAFGARGPGPNDQGDQNNPQQQQQQQNDNGRGEGRIINGRELRARIEANLRGDDVPNNPQQQQQLQNRPAQGRMNERELRARAEALPRDDGPEEDEVSIGAMAAEWANENARRENAAGRQAQNRLVDEGGELRARREAILGNARNEERSEEDVDAAAVEARQGIAVDLPQRDHPDDDDNNVVDHGDAVVPPYAVGRRRRGPRAQLQQRSILQGLGDLGPGLPLHLLRAGEGMGGEGAGAVIDGSNPAAAAAAEGGDAQGNGKEGAQGAGSKVAVFGLECDSALHLAIKQRATEAALDLIKAGACINFPNAKGITPLMNASQEGNLEVVRALLKGGALPNASTIRGSTALIQACHFGKLAVVEELLRNGAMVDKANLKNTTALMRASQEGHNDVVRLLLSRNAGVNRRNDERMTALMLSSQRGHASIVEMLVKAGAQVDAKTAQDSTSLMLACKRKNLGVAKILVASGAELKLKDCKNRTVLETVTRRGGNDEFAAVLTDNAQVRLMQEDSRRERNLAMVCVHKLLQAERATVRLLGGKERTIHEVTRSFEATTPDAPPASRLLLLNVKQLCPSKQALIQAMTLPAPLAELISSFVPLPLIWEKRLMLLTSRSHVDPDSAVFNALDLIDEILEVGGILEAFDAAGVDPPPTFENWSTYQSWCGKCDVILSRCADMDVTNIYAQVSNSNVEIVQSTGPSTKNLLRVEPSQTQRRACNYLQVLARAPPSLEPTLSSHPYDMPSTLLEKLKTCHDIQSLVRRLTAPGGGIHFDTSVANEMVVLARMAVIWAESRPMY